MFAFVGEKEEKKYPLFAILMAMCAAHFGAPVPCQPSTFSIRCCYTSIHNYTSDMGRVKSGAAESLSFAISLFPPNGTSAIGDSLAKNVHIFRTKATAVASRIPDTHTVMSIIQRVQCTVTNTLLCVTVNKYPEWFSWNAQIQNYAHNDTKHLCDSTYNACRFRVKWVWRARMCSILVQLMCWPFELLSLSLLTGDGVSFAFFSVASFLRRHLFFAMK